MILFHTSDWHLGRMLYGRSLLDDQAYFLERVLLPAVERERPACLLLSGDVYDRQVAPVEAIRLFGGFLEKLRKLRCQIAVIPGNHDGADRMVLLKDALRGSGVCFATELSDAFSPILIEQGGERVQIFPLPWFDVSQAREFLGDDSLRGEGACMERLIARMLPLFAPGAAHILMAHCFAAGAVSSDSESSLFVGGSGQVPPALFEPFDYAALGHLHGPQRAGERGRYSGSPLKYSVDEANQKKSFCRLSWDGEALSAEEVPIHPLRDVRRISGLFRDLLEQGEREPVEDYAELILEDKTPVLLAAERLRPGYPNLLAVSNPWAAENTAGERARRLKGRDEATVFSSFLKDVCGTEAEEKDLQLFQEILREVKL